MFARMKLKGINEGLCRFLNVFGEFVHNFSSIDTRRTSFIHRFTHAFIQLDTKTFFKIKKLDSSHLYLCILNCDYIDNKIIPDST